MAHIDYFYVGASPFSYLGHRALEEVARKHGCGIAYKPVRLAALWENSGAVAPAKRPPVRQRYRFLELQRGAERRGLPIKLRPRYFPVDFTLADLAAIVLLQERHDPSDYIFGIMTAVWAKDENISDPRVIEGLLHTCGFDGGSVLEKAQSSEIAAIRERNTEEAIAADAVGVPAYVLNGEVFWGQDRIEWLDHALETGRMPYQTERLAE